MRKNFKKIFGRPPGVALRIKSPLRFSKWETEKQKAPIGFCRSIFGWHNAETDLQKGMKEPTNFLFNITLIMLQMKRGVIHIFPIVGKCPWMALSTDLGKLSTSYQQSIPGWERLPFWDKGTKYR